MEPGGERHLSNNGAAFVASSQAKRVICYCNICRGDRAVSRSTRSRHAADFGFMEQGDGDPAQESVDQHQLEPYSTSGNKAIIRRK